MNNSYILYLKYIYVLVYCLSYIMHYIYIYICILIILCIIYQNVSHIFPYLANMICIYAAYIYMYIYLYICAYHLTYKNCLKLCVGLSSSQAVQVSVWRRRQFAFCVRWWGPGLFKARREYLRGVPHGFMVPFKMFKGGIPEWSVYNGQSHSNG